MFQIFFIKEANMNTKRFSLLLLSLVMVFALCAFTACRGEGGDGSGNANYTPGAEVGNYYCVVDGYDATLTISQNGAVTLKLAKEELSGQCIKDEANPNELTIVFGDTLFANATYNNNVLTFLFRADEYRFLRDVNYTVTFDSMGGSAVEALTVRNGKPAKRPADPQKAGMTFVGWYRDQAFATPFQFGAEPITGNITLYACFVESAGSEVDVNFYLNYEGAGALLPQKTVGGVAQLPQDPVRTGYTFMGWYVSQYNDVAKLAYKYAGQALYEPTSLYAVWSARSGDTLAVSVEGDNIAWTDLGLGTYSVYIYRMENAQLSNGEQKKELVESQSIQNATSLQYNFSKLSAGEYEVCVSKSGKQGSSFFKNKALAKVSLFQTTNGTALSFNAVPGAEEYLLAINCGNKYHKHSALSLGVSTTYNFANCDMQKGGITFTVTAKREGYLSSTSAVYTFEQGLSEVANLKVGENGELTWDSVDKAELYKVTVTLGANVETYYVTEANFSLVNFAEGEYKFAVTALADTYYSPEATELTYAKQNPAAPLNLRLYGRKLEWNAVDGADSYKVIVDGKVLATTNQTNYTLVGSDFSESCTVSVSAIKGTLESFYSAAVKVIELQKFNDSSLTYKNGVVYWDDVFGANKYQVEMGSFKEVLGMDGSEVHSVDLNEYIKASGEYTVKVTAFAGALSLAAQLDFTVYSLQFEPNKGTTQNTLYLANGDDLRFPESQKGGYDFIGWYNTVDGANTNGKRYTDGTFDYKSDMIVYAGWTPKAYEVNLSWKDGETEEKDTQIVYYKENYTLPVPETSMVGYAFEGWYSGSLKMTNELGESLLAYNTISASSYTATFVQTLAFELTTQKDGYAVSATDKIKYVKEITIPAVYNGLPVTEIRSDAFAGANTLVVINIPDTVQMIAEGTKGIDTTGSAFRNMLYLAELNVYEAVSEETLKKGSYTSIDGVLYVKNRDTDAIERLAICPKDKGGELEIPEGITFIGSYSVQNTDITSVVLPWTIEEVQEKAFDSNRSLISVKFADTPEGEEVKNLTFDNSAIYYAYNLLEITLPDRMETFNPAMFRSCSKLAKIEFSEDNEKYSSLDGIVVNKEEDTILYCPVGRSGEFVVPDKITKIGDNAFWTEIENTDESTKNTTPYYYNRCTKLTKLVFHSGVTYIGENAFRGCTGVEQVVFQGTKESPDLTIGKAAFYELSTTNDQAFTEVTLPANLVKLGESAFGKNTKLVKVTVDSVKCDGFADGAFARLADDGYSSQYNRHTVTDLYIGADTGMVEFSAVFGNKLQNVYVDPDNPHYTVGEQDKVVYDKDVTRIIFVPVEKEGEYVTPATVTTIGADTFNGRKLLTKITVGKNVTTIGDSAFANCTDLAEIVFEDERTEDLTFGSNVFFNCDKLTEVALPETTVEIGSMLFDACDELLVVNLPATLAKIIPLYNSSVKEDIVTLFGSSTKKLEEINVAEGNTEFASIDGVLYQKDEGAITTLICAPINYTANSGVIDVPNTVTELAPRALAYSNAKKLTFTNGILEGNTLKFGDQVFDNSKLEEVDLPSGLTEVTDEMFRFCNSLITVVIPNTVTRIGKNAFYSCTSLEYVTIPNSVTLIDEYAFRSCSKLHTVIFEAGNDNVALEFAHGEAVSQTSGPYYYNGIFTNTALKELIFPARTTVIGDFLMGSVSADDGHGSKGNETLEKVVIPSTITYLGQRAFAQCTKLKTVEFSGDGVSELEDDVRTVNNQTGSYARNAKAFHETFLGCTSLETVINLPETTNAEGYSMYAAFDSTALKSVEIPATVANLYNTFKSCNQLTTVTFKENSQLKVLTGTFNGCTLLEAISLPDGLEAIGLTYNTTNMITTGVSTFKDCKSLKSIVIPKTVKTLGGEAFSGCINLADITFETYADGENKGKCDLEEIQYKAFAQTAISAFEFPLITSSSYLTLGQGTTVIPDKGRLFLNCPNLTEVVLSDAVNNFEFVFEGCDAFINAAETTNFSTKEGKPFIYNSDGTIIKYVFQTLPTGKLVIEEGVKEIEGSVFKDQQGITEVFLPYTLQKLGESAFEGCRNLTKVTFEDTALHPSAFIATTTRNNKGVIQAGTSLGKYVFRNCVALESVELPDFDSFQYISQYMFYNTGLKSITLPKSLQFIDNYAFQNCYDLAEVNLPADGQLEAIGTYTFVEACFETIKIPASVKTIGNYAFLSNTNLKEVTFLKDSEGNTNLTELGSNLFGYTSSTLYTPCTALESIVIPKSVTKIGGSAFTGCASLKSVIFEEGCAITDIGANTFLGTAITSITLPDSVKTIGANAFQDCTSLKSFTVPEGVVRLNNSTFMNCTSLETITLHDEINRMDSFVFANCTSLKEVTMPKSLTILAKTNSKYLFTGCTSLEKVTFPEDAILTHLGQYMFANHVYESSYKWDSEGCTALTTITIPDSVVSLGEYTFRGCTNLNTVKFGADSKLTTLGIYTFQNSGIETITVPAGVEYLGTNNVSAKGVVTVSKPSATTVVYTFDGCENLTSVNFLGSVTYIGGYAFNGCTSLVIDLPEKTNLIGKFAFANTASTTFTIPSTVATVGDGAFADNAKLTSFTSNNTKFIVDEDTGALVQKSGNKLLCYPAGLSGNEGTIAIPKGVTIGAYAFSGCSLVTSITLPDDTTTIPNYAFAGATGLKKFTVPQGVTKLGTSSTLGYVFDGCTALEKVEILGNLTMLGGYTFRNCTSLKSFNFPETVTTFGSYVFQGCTALESVTIPSTYSSLASYAFDGCTSLKEVVFETTADDNGVLDGVTSIGMYAFRDCTSLQTVTLPETLTTLNNYVFQGCTALESVTIPSKLTKLSNYAFQGCTALKAVTIPATLTEIGTYVFQDCTSLSSITFQTETKVDEKTGEKTVKGLTKIGEYAFQNTGLTSLVIPAHITSIGTGAFSYCLKLETVEYAEGSLKTGSMVFRGCTSLRTVVLPETLTDIGYGSFWECPVLENINMPSGLVTIGRDVFHDSTSIKKIVFRTFLKTVGSDMFNGWGEDQTICFMFSESEASGWNTSWNKGCRAQIVWDYTEE